MTQTNTGEFLHGLSTVDFNKPFYVGDKPASPLTPQLQTLDRLATTGQAASLRDLALAVDAQADTLHIPARAVYEVMQRTEYLLAFTPGLDFVDALFRLLVVPNKTRYSLTPSPEMRVRMPASILASVQADAVLLDAFTRYQHDAVHRELLACLLQELVLRQRSSIVTDPVVMAFWNSLQAQKHPLAWLPLTLFPVENHLPLPTYTQDHYNLDTWTFEADCKQYAQLLSYEKLSAPPDVDEVTTFAAKKLIMSAVAAWTSEFDNNVEARIFRVTHDITEAMLPAIVRHYLPLDCLKDADQSHITMAALPQQIIFKTLFQAASFGAARPTMIFNAYGRLATWQSLAGLVGLTTSASVDMINQQVQAAQWYTFACDSPWFMHKGYDLRLLALHLDHRVLAILAATS